ncbi:hypothetical protein CGZ93_12710 [Enemella dayhoffiae]|uniref:Uncharacterized protein n=1 Tax=Enemella dayhoffiae TaxID=2016507 RepID=A0A255H014_9ACTN|nr:hypothetical protein [Enemella dayhoffiae]OYO19244.1 hypothetical protein CGZ93_12710 [Enemella dayhoffiae]
MWPICRSAVAVLATTVAAAFASAWELRADNTLVATEGGRNGLGWLTAPGQSLGMPLLALFVLALLTTRASWIGGFALPLVQAAASYHLVAVAVPGAVPVIVGVCVMSLAAYALWLVRTWIDWPFPTVPALYAQVPMAVAAALLVVLFAPTGPGAAPGVLLHTMVPLLLAGAAIAVTVIRVAVGAQRELMRLEAAIGILVPLLVSWSVWSQAGQRHLVLYAFLLALVSAALHLAYVGPRRLVQWAVRESQRPWPRFL